MTLVMRYLLVNQVDREVNSVLTSSLIGSERQNGRYSAIRVCMFERAKTRPLSPW